MKIVFLTQDDPLYILPFFEEFFLRDRGTIEVAGIFTCKTMGDRGRLRLAGELLQLYGGLGFARLATRALILKAMSQLPKTRSSQRFFSIRQICRTFVVHHSAIGNPNKDEYRTKIEALAPDLLVSIACPYILKEKLLQMPPLGCINMHHAPLPRYKGMMPTFWQMYQGEKTVGVTIHYMAARVDEGAALLQEQLEIRPSETLDQLIRRSKRHGAHCMTRVLREIAARNQRTWTFEGQEGTYFTFPTSAEMKEFRRRGLRAI